MVADESAELANRLLVDAGRGRWRVAGRLREIGARLLPDLPSDAQLARLDEHARRGRGRSAARGLSLRLELGQEPAARIAADVPGVAGLGAEPEAVGGDRGFTCQHRGFLPLRSIPAGNGRD